MFPSLPDDARVWIFVANRSLTSEEEKNVLHTLRRFLSSWQTHGHPVTAEADIRDKRFLIVAGYIPGEQISGCGIDTMTGVVEMLGAEMGITWLPGLMIHYRDHEGHVQSVTRGDFRRLLQEGKVGPSTPVFNPALTRLETLRRGHFEQPLHCSPFARIFRVTSDPEST